MIRIMYGYDSFFKGLTGPIVAQPFFLGYHVSREKDDGNRQKNMAIGGQGGRIDNSVFGSRTLEVQRKWVPLDGTNAINTLDGKLQSTSF